MNSSTSNFLVQQFDSYYKKTQLAAPSSLDQREWGFVMFEPDVTSFKMRRHIGFIKDDNLFKYMKSQTPRHSFYSTAYYEIPNAENMQEKIWLGADLIFDLDADHLMKGPYDQMLARVKEETEKLLSMLTIEFGIDTKTIELVFSGGRGYHVHVKDVTFRQWNSTERRELIDYVCGIGIEPAAMFSGKKPVDPGWKMRYHTTLMEHLSWIGNMKNEDAISYLTKFEGVGKDSAATFLKNLKETTKIVENHPPANIILKNKIINAILTQQDGEFKKKLLSHAALADEPVTTDTKRLIRMPTSLHGGSGMQVQSLEIKKLHDFDPLIDAIVFSAKDTKIDLTIDKPNQITVPMLGNSYVVNKGVNIVPEAVAIFLCCRGMAEIV
jgi:DNA primase small subunit